jgi:hypothetical protein
MTKRTALDNPILAEHAAEIRRLGKRVVGDVIEIGGRLVECRAILKDDGRWRTWLESELNLSPQTAGRFIQVPELSQGRSNLEHLELPVSALYLLAAPSTPETAKTEILERAKTGERLPVAEVRRVVDAAKGRQQPARDPTHVCWQCGQRGKVGEVQQHCYPAYEDVWLHEACVSAFDQAEQQREQEREAAAERIRALMPPSPVARDDVGPDSASEAERLRICVENLQAEKRRLEIKIAGLESEVEELRERLAAKATSDISSSEFQAAIQKWEAAFEVQKNIIRDRDNEIANLKGAR